MPISSHWVKKTNHKPVKPIKMKSKPASGESAESGPQTHELKYKHLSDLATRHYTAKTPTSKARFLEQNRGAKWCNFMQKQTGQCKLLIDVFDLNN